MGKGEKVKFVSTVKSPNKAGAFLSARFIGSCKFSLFSFFAFFLFSFFPFSFVFAQTSPKPANPPKSVPKPNREGGGKTIENQSRIPAEKSIAADAKVNIKLCVSRGRLKINGWERREIRAFVAGGSQVGFKILQKGASGENPVWIQVLGFEPSKNAEADSDECLAGEEIELDVPRGATVSVKSRESDAIVDSIEKITIENVGGDIRLSNIRRGVEATTYEGGLTIEKSGGAMQLATTTGNIVVAAAAPDAVGDVFKAKTNSGAIVLQQTAHRQIEASSNSGTIKFAGELLSGGQYSFNAFNGAINLTIPQNSSCKINASYGFGTFDSEIPLQNAVKSFASARAQNLSAQIGSGEATLNLTTYSGTIQIKKQ